MPKKQTSAPQPAFFETTPLKLAILSICTFGVYEIYWFYKMWRRAFPKGNKFAAIVRALFCRIFLYQLLKSHQLPHAIWLAIAYFAVGFAIQLPTFWGVVLSYLTFVPLVHVQMQLNKRLKKPVKAPFTWRSIVVGITGVILSILFFALASGYNASADQNSATTAPTASHKVAKETTNNKPTDTAQSATATDDSTSSGASSSDTASSSPATSGTSTAKKSSSAPAEPTVYPHADMERIRREAGSYDPYPNNPQVTSVSVSPNNTCGSTGYHYDIHFLGQSKPGIFAAQWEVVSGVGGVPSFPHLDIGGGIVQIYDTLQYGFDAAEAPYTVRLHVTSPNSMYSNAITIVSCS